MGLNQVQRILAWLVTDADSLAAFREDPLSVGAIEGLSSPETEALIGLLDEALPAFSRSLLRKRFAEIRGLLPVTLALLGQEAWKQFEGNAASRPLGGGHPQREDAMALARGLLGNPTFSPGFREVVRYELDCLEAWDRSWHFRLRFLFIDFGWLAQRDALPACLPPESRRPGVGIWLRLGASRNVWHRRISLAVHNR